MDEMKARQRALKGEIHEGRMRLRLSLVTQGKKACLIQSTGHCVVWMEFSTSHSPPPSSPLSLLLFLITPFSPDTDGAMGVQLRQSQSVNAGKRTAEQKAFSVPPPTGHESTQITLSPDPGHFITTDLTAEEKKKRFYSSKIWNFKRKE